MGKNVVRTEIVCLNCEHPFVMERFCPGCGQENVETRQTFGHLFVHFIEDLTHYEGTFWKTIKYLLFYPGRLTVDYIAGKRKKFVPPVKLYIFVSFLTFFLIAILPDLSEATYNGPVIARKPEADSPEAGMKRTVPSFFNSVKYSSVAEYDDIQNSLPENLRDGIIESFMSRKVIASLERNTDEEIFEKMDGVFFSNMPKTIFLYLPIFGFFLWLFHGKKRWFFFDHGIFTLHYFSFILLLLTISITCLERVYLLIPNQSVAFYLSNITGVVTCLWIVAYFYIGHKRLYKESGLISFLKCSALLLINLIFIALLALLLIWYSFVTI